MANVTASAGRLFYCQFPGDDGRRYIQDIAGASYMITTMHGVVNVSSGGVDIQCAVSGDSVQAIQGRFTAVRLGGVVVQ